jgi:pyrroline-5-carboxylate reductase
MIGFIGIGNIGKAVLDGYIALCEQNHFSSSLKKAIVYNRSPKKVEAYKQTENVIVADSLDAVLEQADVLFLGIKPQGFADFQKQIEAVYLKNETARRNAKNQTIVSFAAGISIAKIVNMLGFYKVVRTMPNTPMLAGYGFTGISRNKAVSDEDWTFIKAVFASLGEVAEIDEGRINALAALSGSGPAYLFLWMEEMQKAATKLGLPENIAKKATIQTVIGAGVLASESSESFEQLRKNVCSPGGTTIEAIDHFIEKDMENIILEAMEKTVIKSEKLG